MTYNFTRNAVEGTSLHFTRNTSDLPLDKLRCFWRLDGAGTTALDSIGTMNLRADGGGSSPTRVQYNSQFLSLSASRPDGVGNSTNFGAYNHDASYNTSPNPPAFLATGVTPFAFTGWARCSDRSTYYQSILSQYQFTNVSDELDRVCMARLVPGGTLAFIAWYDTSNYDRVVTTDTFTDDTWAFFAFGSDGTNYWVSLNGGTAVTTAISSPGFKSASTHPLKIGRDATNAAQAWGGEICDVAYWYNQGLFTAGQLADLYNSGNGNTLLRG